jgi:hypothetical protein
MPRRPAWSRLTSMLLLFLMLPQLTGCQGYQPVLTPEPELRAAKPRTSYRIWITPERHITLREITVSGDSIRGVHRYVDGDSVVTMHRRDARVVEKVSSDAGTVFLGLLLVGAIGLGAMANSGGWGGPSFSFE